MKITITTITTIADKKENREKLFNNFSLFII